MDAAAAARRSKRLNRQLDKIIIHFDYDCFYASVFERETPALRALPLAVQQKQIVVTCNYEARRRGLRKLQLITEAKKVCPDVVIVLGEDLTRFRDASKELYSFLRAFSWNSKIERLGFDEVFMDVSDIVEYNVGLLNNNDLTKSFFCLSKSDPTIGFEFDASQVAGHMYPDLSNDKLSADASQIDPLRLRLHLGSHLANHLRFLLHSEKGYTCTIGISTNKLLAKLVGNVHKPDAQTTLMPPYVSYTDELDNVTAFLDAHEVREVPGIGFKLAQKLREYVLCRPLPGNGETDDEVFVADVRRQPEISAETLERVLAGPGTPHGIGAKVWGLLNGVDDSDVSEAQDIPKQISIEDSYRRLDKLDEVLQELRRLASSLIRRMHIDLIEDDGQDEDEEPPEAQQQQQQQRQNSEADDNLKQKKRRWVAYPKTIRLSTRPRPPQTTDGNRYRSLNRISRSAPMPNFVFSSKESVDVVTERLVVETLVPLFRRLHPEKKGWDLSLINVAATNMADAANDSKQGVGRDILKMFKQHDSLRREFTITEGDLDTEMNHVEAERPALVNCEGGSEDSLTRSQESYEEGSHDWEEDEEDSGMEKFECERCGAMMPVFASAAHERWHVSGE